MRGWLILAAFNPSLVITSFWKPSLSSQASPRSLWRLGRVTVVACLRVSLYPTLDCKLGGQHQAYLIDPRLLYRTDPRHWESQMAGMQ